MRETDNAIYFFGKNVEFSNFYPCIFVKHDITFNCTEQYFMYKKCMHFDCKNTELINNILTETNPKVIQKYGRNVNNYDEEIWNNLRYAVMLDTLFLKFSQNENLKQMLLNTNNKILYEASKYDKIWGIGYDEDLAVDINPEQYGKNLLGQALMETRVRLFELSKIN